MVLWIGFALLAAAVVWAVTRPLLTPPADAAAAGDSELAVYRDQLAEIESERAQGLLGGAEAEGARVELARRLIQRSEEKQRAGAAAQGSIARARAAVTYAAAALPVIGIGVYLAVGSPQLSGRPYAGRLDMPMQEATAADLVARVEAHLREHPEDGRGWDVLAPVYMRMGDFTQAADAFQKAARLLGESPKRIAGFARAIIMVQNGVISEPARQAYEKLRTLEPQSIEPQVWLAIAREQDGDLKGAEAEYRTLLVGAEDPWKGLLEARLGALTEKVGAPAPATGAPAAQPEAMSAADRDKFILQMVDGLAARLKQNGNDLEGWMRLVRSYMVLDRRDDAATALASARRQFSGDEKSLAELNVLAESLGLGS
ncbi:MAG TPA: c-type cytochrome biogenesis protein CcmI [Hyphomicrobium sp.]|jgi:cytochrome c-type biogenesis protein CcmH